MKASVCLRPYSICGQPASYERINEAVYVSAEIVT